MTGVKEKCLTELTALERMSKVKNERTEIVVKQEDESRRCERRREREKFEEKNL